MHEAQMTNIADGCSFLTLTYDDENLPKDGGLHLSDWQNFAKKFRRDIGKFRFYTAGEYGDESSDGFASGRPHWHVACFGHNFSSDRKLYKTGKFGDPLYTSDTLSGVWKKGYAVIGELTPESAAYVASYCMKKRTGKDGVEKPYVNKNGEEIKAPFAVMSRNPGIGAGWFEKNKSDLNKDFVTLGTGRKYFVPKFYDRMQDPSFLEGVKKKRKERALKHSWNNTPDRLRVRENVAVAREAKLGRTYHEKD